MIILAVDPGASGGLAWDVDGVVYCAPMPATEGDVVRLLMREELRGGHTLRNRQPEVRTAYVEQIVKHMGAGIPASTMAVYAANYGFILGALQMDGWVIHLTTPQRWQKALGLGITGRQKVAKGLTGEVLAMEKVRIQHLNQQLKRDWKNKLLAEAQRLNPALDVT